MSDASMMGMRDAVKDRADAAGSADTSVRARRGLVCRTWIELAAASLAAEDALVDLDAVGEQDPGATRRGFVAAAWT